MNSPIVLESSCFLTFSVMVKTVPLGKLLCSGTVHVSKQGLLYIRTPSEFGSGGLVSVLLKKGLVCFGSVRDNGGGSNDSVCVLKRRIS